MTQDARDPNPQRIDPRSRPRPELLEGPRIALRQLSEDEIPTLASLLSDPAVSEWWPIASEASLREDICGSDETIGLAILVDDSIAGVVMYEEVLWRDYFSAGIDIALGGPFLGRGYGAEALHVLVRWLIDVAGHHRITLDPAAANVRAIRAYEKVGFKPVGVMRQYECGPDGTWRDSLLMDLLAEELAPLDIGS